jgi:MFS family permease
MSSSSAHSDCAGTPPPVPHASSSAVSANLQGGKGRSAAALARYVFAATLVRSADGGAVVAIVLLAHAQGTPSWVAGLLGASITAPHLLGPFIARRLDTARDGRIVIALSAVAHGVLLGAAALLLPVAWAIWPAVLLFASGLFGPMLTGGISSRLPSIAGPQQSSQRRAQSWDVASYGISGTLGPVAVAWIAAASNPLTATLVLAGAAVLGAGAVLALPRQEPPKSAEDVPSPTRTLRLIWERGPLRRTLGLTVTVAFSVAALPIYAVAIAPGFGGAATAGTLVAAYGVGNLLGSVLLMIRPLRHAADPLMSSLAALVAATLILVILSPTLPTALTTFCLAGVTNALFFAATLAARSEYAPIDIRGQVFIWVGALKIAAGSAGTAAAGAAVPNAVWVPLLLATTLIVIAVCTTTIQRHRPGRG